MKLNWTSDELQLAHGLLPTMEHLYGRGRSSWKPILHYGDFDRKLDWSPRNEAGRMLPPLEKLSFVSAWGGLVEDYERGCEQQPVELCFIGLDIDVDFGRNPAVLHVPSTVAAALPEGYVRLSTGGKGAHSFLILEDPILCGSKAEALALGKRIAQPYLQRLHAVGVRHVCSLVNPLKIWSIGGSQKDYQAGNIIHVDLASLPALASNNVAGRGSGESEARWNQCGPFVRLILERLNVPVDADGQLPEKFSCHVVKAQEALFGLLKFKTISAGTCLHEHNSYLVINTDGIALFSCPDGTDFPLFSLSLDQ